MSLQFWPFDQLQVALEAAYLADVLGRVPQIRAGLPATVPDGPPDGQSRGLVDFFDGDAGMWRVSHGEQRYWATEQESFFVVLNFGFWPLLRPNFEQIGEHWFCDSFIIFKCGIRLIISH